MSVGFFFDFGGTTLQLPVNPPELALPASGKNETAEIISQGDVTVLRKPGLITISLESYFPYYDDARVVMTKHNFKSPQYCIDYFKKARENKKPGRFVVADIGVNMLVSIEDFEYKYTGLGKDVYYSLTIKEYKEYGAKVIATVAITAAAAKPAAQPASQTTRPNTSGAITVGANVIVNGRLHRDSYGGGAGQTRTNYKGKISIINTKSGATHPYHVTTPTGGAQGWVLKSAVKLA